MRAWRAAAMAGLMGLGGFVGGVWFVSSEWAFRLIRLPNVPAASLVTPSIGRPTGSPLPSQPKVEAVGVPPFWSVAGGTGGLGRPAERSDLLPGAGCLWEIEPRPMEQGTEWSSRNVERLLMGVPTLDFQSRSFRYHLTQVTRPGQPVHDLRVVLFDAAGNRFPGRWHGSGRSVGPSEAIQFRTFDWDDLPPLDDPTSVYFGVERIPPDHQKLAADAARAEAKAKGIELLPPPRIGEPFPLDLATVEGGRIKAADLRGRAVLIVVTGPFPRGPMTFLGFRKEFTPSDLAVVNVSFVGDAEEAKTERDRLGEAAPLVHVPNNPVARRLWREGVELPYLPVCLLIDREGVLRFQCQWFDLSDRVATTLGRPTHLAQFQAKAREAAAKARSEMATAPPSTPGQAHLRSLAPPPTRVP